MYICVLGAVGYFRLHLEVEVRILLANMLLVPFSTKLTE